MLLKEFFEKVNFENCQQTSKKSEKLPRMQRENVCFSFQIDPVRTISAGKVNIGAFRTYPKGYKAPDEAQSEYQSIPLSKIEDFGVHCKK